MLAKLEEEIREVADVLDDPAAAARELGDVLFAAVNLARHLGIDAELALRATTARFEARFRWMEGQVADRDLAALTLDEYDALWEQAKAAGAGD